MTHEGQPKLLQCGVSHENGKGFQSGVPGFSEPRRGPLRGAISPWSLLEVAHLWCAFSIKSLNLHLHEMYALMFPNLVRSVREEAFFPSPKPSSWASRHPESINRVRLLSAPKTLFLELLFLQLLRFAVAERCVHTFTTTRLMTDTLVICIARNLWDCARGKGPWSMVEWKPFLLPWCSATCGYLCWKTLVGIGQKLRGSFYRG